MSRKISMFQVEMLKGSGKRGSLPGAPQTQVKMKERSQYLQMGNTCTSQPVTGWKVSENVIFTILYLLETGGEMQLIRDQQLILRIPISIPA